MTFICSSRFPLACLFLLLIAATASAAATTGNCCITDEYFSCSGNGGSCTPNAPFSASCSVCKEAEFCSPTTGTCRRKGFADPSCCLTTKGETCRSGNCTSNFPVDNGCTSCDYGNQFCSTNGRCLSVHNYCEYTSECGIDGHCNKLLNVCSYSAAPVSKQPKNTPWDWVFISAFGAALLIVGLWRMKSSASTPSTSANTPAMRRRSLRRGRPRDSENFGTVSSTSTLPPYDAAAQPPAYAETSSCPDLEVDNGRPSQNSLQVNNDGNSGEGGFIASAETHVENLPIEGLPEGPPDQSPVLDIATAADEGTAVSASTAAM